MKNPYQPPKTQHTEKRVFKTPIITPISIVAVIAIYFGYTYFHFSNEESGIFEILKGSSFEIFLLCEFGLVSLILYNKRQLSDYLKKYPVVSNQISLNILHPIIRTNMYSSLFSLFFIALGSLTAIMTITNHGLVKGIVVAVFSIIAGIAMKVYTPLENELKQIECTDKTIDEELNKLLHCWQHKALPNF